MVRPSLRPFSRFTLMFLTLFMTGWPALCNPGESDAEKELAALNSRIRFLPNDIPTAEQATIDEVLTRLTAVVPDLGKDPDRLHGFAHILRNEFRSRSFPSLNLLAAATLHELAKRFPDDTALRYAASLVASRKIQNGDAEDVIDLLVDLTLKDREQWQYHCYEALSGFDRPTQGGDRLVAHNLSREWHEWSSTTAVEGLHVGPDLRKPLLDRISRGLLDPELVKDSAAFSSWFAQTLKRAEHYRGALPDETVRRYGEILRGADARRNLGLFSVLARWATDALLKTVFPMAIDAAITAAKERLTQKNEPKPGRREELSLFLLLAFCNSGVMSEEQRQALRDLRTAMTPAVRDLESYNYMPDLVAITSLLWRFDNRPVDEFLRLGPDGGAVALKSKGPWFLRDYGQIFLARVFDPGDVDEQTRLKIGDIGYDLLLLRRWPDSKEARPALDRVLANSEARWNDPHSAMNKWSQLAKLGTSLDRLRDPAHAEKLAADPGFATIPPDIRADLLYRLGNDAAGAEQVITSVIAQKPDLARKEVRILSSFVRTSLAIQPRSAVVDRLRALIAHQPKNAFWIWMIDVAQGATDPTFPDEAYGDLFGHPGFEDACLVLADLGPSMARYLPLLRQPHHVVPASMRYGEKVIRLLSALDRIEWDSRGLAWPR